MSLVKETAFFVDSYNKNFHLKERLEINSKQLKHSSNFVI